MRVGELARCIHTGEVLIVTSPANNAGYVDVYNSRLNVYWHMPKEHLEVMNESR